MKRISIIFLMVLVLLFSFSLYGCSKSILSINGETINEKELDKYMKIVKSQYPEGTLEEESEQYESIRVNILDSLIVIRLLDQYAAENGIEVSAEEVEKEYRLMVETYQSEEQLEEYLKSQGIDKDTLKKELRNRIIRMRIYDHVTADIPVSEEKALQYYEEYKESLYTEPARVKASHILAKFELDDGEVEPTESARQEALDKIKHAQSRLEDGEAFEGVAREISDDPPSAENGGELGYISTGETVKEFEEVAFSLNVGEISDIVETVYGFHIIKVTDKRPQQVKEFSEVKESVIASVKKEEESRFWKDFVFSLIDTAEIEYFADIGSNLVPEQDQE